MQRLRLYDVRTSVIPSDLGLCDGDLPGVAQMVNAAQRRLIYAKEAGEEGWWGGWAEMAFTNVSRTNPFVTTPRGVARLQSFNICQRPIPVQNQFYEYLQFGNGRLPKQRCRCNGPEQAYSRNNAITFTEMAAPSFIKAYPTDSADIQRRTLIQGTDNNNNTIYSEDILGQVMGLFVTLTMPWGITPIIYKTITGIQKDVTVGQVRYFAVDPTTGVETLLLTMEPGETTASYRRYYLGSLPLTCCPIPVSTPAELTVTAIAKLDLIPVVVDTDYCLIQNLEALNEEMMSYRYSKMDTLDSKKLEQVKHISAIRLLNGELTHFLGRDEPAVNFAPFGTARLSRQRIGTMI